MNLFGLVEKKDWRHRFFFFFFCCGLVVAAAAAVVDGRSGCGWCCENFLDSGIYYFIVVVILFYCGVYIILLY